MTLSFPKEYTGQIKITLSILHFLKKKEFPSTSKNTIAFYNATVKGAILKNILQDLHHFSEDLLEKSLFPLPTPELKFNFR